MISIFARLCAPVFNYHGCFEETPTDVSPLDSITPQALYSQIESAKRWVRFITIDELSSLSTLSGVAAVTFDDGYKSVIETALPVFEALNVPFTIFVNTKPLEGKIFWRHKVVALTAMGRADECDAALKHLYRHPGLTFYQNLKHPNNNSRQIEEQLDEVLSSHDITLHTSNHLFDNVSYLQSHKLISYGNHSHSHYVLSSLSRSEQCEEIAKTKTFLEGVPGLQVSKVFSLPFGQEQHVNLDTLAALRENGYQTLLMNRGGVNRHKIAIRGDIRIVDRFSPVERLPIGRQVVKEFIRTLAGR
jgi:peptidoglycan/xylan/chitin deacetylase (PgdA/CDA1 family)